MFSHVHLGTIIVVHHVMDVVYALRVNRVLMNLAVVGVHQLDCVSAEILPVHVLARATTGFMTSAELVANTPIVVHV